MKKISKTELAALKTYAATARKVLRPIDHKLRFNMLNLLLSKGRMTVTDLYIELRLEQSVASQHLAILRNQDFVATEREGKFIYYKLNHGRLLGLLDELEDIEDRQADAHSPAAQGMARLGKMIDEENAAHDRDKKLLESISGLMVTAGG